MQKLLSPFRLPGFAAITVLAHILALGVPTDTASADSPSFRNDVMAVLSKAGCNMGTCHGNQNGKNGFRLSLRGEDPQLDHRWLLREFGGRRVDRMHPEQSLMLLKPTGRLAHQGGVRFELGSLEYGILRDWIAAGAAGLQDGDRRLERLEVQPAEQVVVAPEDRVQLSVTAHFSDGATRDVSRLAVYEPSTLGAEVTIDGLVTRRDHGETTIIVRYLDQQVPVPIAFVPARPDFAWQPPPENNFIDRHIWQKLQRLRMMPSQLAEDTVFVRRAFLDALGVLPSAEEARSFVADTQPDKRARLIDDLLSRPEFAEHWALKWADVLRNEEKVLDPTGVSIFHSWIRDSIATGKPVDQFVRELVTATGSTYEHAPANYYRANRDPTTRGETTARLFLGVRLQCARCHTHPFDRWTQDDYYGWAANFARIDYEIVKNERRDKLDKNEFNGEQIVKIADEGEVRHAETGQVMAPRFLGGGLSPTSHAGASTSAGEPARLEPSRLEPLAEWLTSPDNELFVRSQVNFVWYHLMGRGIVEPLDDFRLTNPPVNPPLLDALAEDFVAHRFDLRHLVRTIMNSHTYQLSAMPTADNAGDEMNFSHALVRRLTAEQLLDAQSQVLGAPAKFAGQPPGTRAGELAGVHKVGRRGGDPGDGDRFLMTFGKPERLLACECERSNETTLAQAFTLTSGQGLNDRLQREGNQLQQMADSPAPTDSLVVQLYWAALSRPPGGDELLAAVRLVDESPSRWLGLQDLAWALLNSKEFIFRR